MSCPGAELFDLADGRMGVARAQEVRAHLRGCSACQSQLAMAEAIVAETAILRAAPPPELEARLWQALAPEVEQASARARKRAAWRELLGRRALETLELAWPRDGESGWRVWLPRVAWTAALAVILLAVLGPDAVTEPPEVAAPAQLVAADSTVSLAAELPEGALRSAVSPPRSVFPTTAPASVDASGSAVNATNATSGAPALAPRHVRGWHHVASAANAADATPGQALLACGAVVDLTEADATLVQNLPNDAEVELAQGRVVVRVPKLPTGGKLIVRTPDASVQVKGTAFAVDKRSKDWTTIEVFEGVVQVDAAGHGREPQAGRETFLLHAGETRRVESVDAYLRRQIAELDDALATGRLEIAHEKARRYLAVAGADGPDVDDVQLRLGGILSRTGHAAEAARLYRTVADGDGPVYARQNALAVLAVLHRDGDRAEAERSTWAEYLVRFPDGLYVREALVRQVELSCGRPDGGRSDGSVEQARRSLAARFGQEPTAAAVLERCRPR
jgi:hypothetical protein